MLTGDRGDSKKVDDVKAAGNQNVSATRNFANKAYDYHAKGANEPFPEAADIENDRNKKEFQQAIQHSSVDFFQKRAEEISKVLAFMDDFEGKARYFSFLLAANCYLRRGDIFASRQTLPDIREAMLAYRNAFKMFHRLEIWDVRDIIVVPARHLSSLLKAVIDTKDKNLNFEYFDCLLQQVEKQESSYYYVEYNSSLPVLTETLLELFKSSPIEWQTTMCEKLTMSHATANRNSEQIEFLFTLIMKIRNIAPPAMRASLHSAIVKERHLIGRLPEADRTDFYQQAAQLKSIPALLHLADEEKVQPKERTDHFRQAVELMIQQNDPRMLTAALETAHTLLFCFAPETLDHNNIKETLQKLSNTTWADRSISTADAACLLDIAIESKADKSIKSYWKQLGFGLKDKLTTLKKVKSDSVHLKNIVQQIEEEHKKSSFVQLASLGYRYLFRLNNQLAEAKNSTIETLHYEEIIQNIMATHIEWLETKEHEHCVPLLARQLAHPHPVDHVFNQESAYYANGAFMRKAFLTQCEESDNPDISFLLPVAACTHINLADQESATLFVRAIDRYLLNVDPHETTFFKNAYSRFRSSRSNYKNELLGQLKKMAELHPDLQPRIKAIQARTLIEDSRHDLIQYFNERQLKKLTEKDELLVLDECLKAYASISPEKAIMYCMRILTATADLEQAAETQKLPIEQAKEIEMRARATFDEFARKNPKKLAEIYRSMPVPLTNKPKTAKTAAPIPDTKSVPATNETSNVTSMMSSATVQRQLQTPTAPLPEIRAGYSASTLVNQASLEIQPQLQELSAPPKSKTAAPLPNKKSELLAGESNETLGFDLSHVVITTNLKKPTAPMPDADAKAILPADIVTTMIVNAHLPEPSAPPPSYEESERVSKSAINSPGDPLPTVKNIHTLHASPAPQVIAEQPAVVAPKRPNRRASPELVEL